MGGSLSTTRNATAVSRCDDGTTPGVDISTNSSPPPMRRVLTVEEKMWEKVRS